MASIKASLAFARAFDIASPWLAERRVMEDSESSPTATIVSNIIRLRVTMSAKPPFDAVLG